MQQTEGYTCGIDCITQERWYDTIFADYRELNNVTMKGSYPLPQIDDMLDTIAHSKIFSTLDLKNSYWQVEMDSENPEKTAFAI